jgi:hypothetical protein
MVDSRPLGAGRLSATTTAGGTATTTALATKVAARVVASASIVSATTTARSTATAGTVAAAAVSIGLGAARLDDDVLAVDGQRAGSNGSVVALNSLVFDKSAVLSMLV